MSASSAKSRGCEFALAEVWEKGGEGGIALAEKVLDDSGNTKKAISYDCTVMSYQLTREDRDNLQKKFTVQTEWLILNLQRRKQIDTN